ncbi:ABC transporter permease [Microbacterium sp.]|uniref:ABC transporter permease n=1 Tax=Microbacterium sp. TaxID=51671 RepID=UPI003F9ACA77
MRPLPRWLLPAGCVVLTLAIWQALTATGFLSRREFPTATDTLATLGEIALTPHYWSSVFATLQAWLWGMVIASVLAIIIGCILAFNDFAARSVAGVIEIFKAIPAIAVLPLVILVLGSTLEMKVFLIVFAAFWPLVIQVIYGVRSVDPVALDTARSLGVRRMLRFAVVTLPGASPFIATGLRIAAATALILSIVSELVGGADGIGRNILQAQNGGSLSSPTMYAYIITAGLLGVVVTGAFTLLERRLLSWHESIRAAHAVSGADA